MCGPKLLTSEAAEEKEKTDGTQSQDTTVTEPVDDDNEDKDEN